MNDSSFFSPRRVPSSKKRARSVLDEVLTIKQEYAHHVELNVLSLIESHQILSTALAPIYQAYDSLDNKIELALDREQQAEQELEEENMYHLKNPINHLYIKKMALLRKQGRFVNDTYALLDRVNNSIRYIKSCIYQIRELYDDQDSPELQEHLKPMIVVVTELESMQRKMGLRIRFIPGQMRKLIHLYDKDDAGFQKDVNAKLNQKPKLLAWAMQFLNLKNEENTNPLDEAVKTLKPKPSKLTFD